MEWTKEILTEFVELYRERPCLWKIKDTDYVNKNLKREAYEDLIKFLKSKNYNNVTIKDVKTKIQNIRNAFRRECKKMENSKRSGSLTENVYVTTLWYYNLLLFTKDQDVPLVSIDSQSMDAQTLIEDTETQNENISDEDDLNQSVADEATTNASSKESVEKVFKQPPEKRVKKKRTSNTDLDEFVKVCTKTLSNPDKPDEFDSTCMSFAAKLRKMNADQHIFAESIMHKVCTLGLLNKLNENYCVTDNNRMPPQFHSSNSLRNDYQHLVQTQVTAAEQSSYSSLSNMCQTNYRVQPPLPSPDESTQSSASSTHSPIADYYNDASNNNDFQ